MSENLSIHQILKKYWGYDQFRPLQQDIIESVLEGKDTLALMPTGGGKSLCFQVPAMQLPGLCVVVSPLIALMRDQVDNLKQRGIEAIALHSGLTHQEIDSGLTNCMYGQIKFLYLSPERLKSDMLLARLERMRVSLLAIDEAHCISQWGYDFRPPYLQIAEFRAHIPSVALIALTASATPEVQEDIKQKLNFGAVHAVFKQSFARPNLSYSCFQETNKQARLIHILKKVPASAVVYVRSRKTTEQTAAALSRMGISATFYHAGLSGKERHNRQTNWQTNKTRVMVATNAFGMGIDKPDVRLVVHLDIPPGLEDYYQEAGRAGRDGQKAYAVLLYDQNDMASLAQNLENAYPPIERIRHTYQTIANYLKIPIGTNELGSFEFDFAHFCQTYNLPAVQTLRCIRLLTLQGFLQLSDSFMVPGRVQITATHLQLYEFQVFNQLYDPLIKTLLRLYGSVLLDGFGYIDEAVVAKQISADSKFVCRLLNQLEAHNMLIYKPQTDKPMITFLTFRYDAQQLPIDTVLLENMRQTDVRRANALTHYLRSQTDCRTTMILDYFGQNGYQGCGVCDICLIKKKAAKSELGNDISGKLLAMANSPSNLQDLINQFPQTEQANTMKHIQTLLDNKILVYTQTGQIISA